MLASRKQESEIGECETVLSFSVMDVRRHNRQAWDKAVEMDDVWTRPVATEVIEAARRGDWEIFLTECKPMPRDWLPEPKGKRILCLASAGGQQAPLLAAAGAEVTSFDNSPRQLLQDKFVADRDGLDLETVEGDMRDLSVFGSASFDVVVHACSNLFVPDVNPVWRECYRVLRPGGALLAGFLNPMEYIFDPEREDEGLLEVRYSLPFSDVSDLSPEAFEKRMQKGDPLEFSHSLDDQLGGQLAAGFVLTGLFESHRERGPKSKMFPSYIATRAVKPDWFTEGDAFSV